MVVDGKRLAADLIAKTKVRAEKLADFGVPQLAIITCAPTFETQKYLALKQRKAAAAGVAVTVTELPKEATTEAVNAAILGAIHTHHGIVVQLPLPVGIDREVVLQAIPVTHDPDGFWYGKKPEALASPVVVAVKEIAAQYGVDFRGRNVVVLGNGRLVGQPVSYYLESVGAITTVLTDSSINIEQVLNQAEVVVTGVGKPHLVTPEMVRGGVVIFDAGTSEDGGVLAGDVSPLVAEKASLFTPVPGGIGPITVAALLANVVTLAERQWQTGG